MLYDLLIIAVCALWCLLCVAILMYLNLDKLRTQTQRIWTWNRDGLADWYGIHFSSRKPHQQVAELIAVKKLLSAATRNGGMNLHPVIMRARTDIVSGSTHLYFKRSERCSVSRRCPGCNAAFLS